MMQVLVNEDLAKSCSSVGVRVSTIQLEQHAEKEWELDGEICVLRTFGDRDRFNACEAVECFKLSDILLTIIEDLAE